MKIGIFDPYLDILGGAERYVLTIAEDYSQTNEVDVFWQNNLIADKIQTQFAFDMSRVRFIPFPTSLITRMKILRKYDIFLYVTDGSIFFSTAKRSILLIQTPDHIPEKKVSNAMKLTSWEAIICYSQFMERIIHQRMNRKAIILFPPIDVSAFKSAKKENIILSVGRFFPHLHSKKQDLLIDAFRKLSVSGRLSGWQMVLIGAIKDDPDALAFLSDLRKKAQNYDIKIIVNAPFSMVKKFYERAKIFWLATGFGEDLATFPQKAEHFGMVSIEAMAAGCVPVVFQGGGQKEIVHHGRNGYLFKTENELISYTLKLMTNDTFRQELSQKAKKRSHDFTRDKFIRKFNEIITA